VGILATQIFLSIFWHKFISDTHYENNQTQKEFYGSEGCPYQPPCEDYLPKWPILASLVALGEIFIFVSMVHTFVG